MKSQVEKVTRDQCRSNKDLGFIAWLAVEKKIFDVPYLREIIKKGQGRYWFQLTSDQMTALKNEYDQTKYIEVWLKAKRLKDLTF